MLHKLLLVVLLVFNYNNTRIIEFILLDVSTMLSTSWMICCCDRDDFANEHHRQNQSI